MGTAEVVMAETIRFLHVAAGSVALLSFLVPLVARKGSRLHRRAGWTYAGAMAVVAATGVAMVGAGLAAGEAVEARLFLLFVAWLSVTSVWTGLRALRHKRRTGPHDGLLDLAIPAVLLVAGAALSAWGLAGGGVVRIVFGLVGVSVGYGQLRYWRTAPTERRHWWFEHSGNLLGAGIGTFTAFLVVNAERIGLPGTFAWLLPTLVGIPAIVAVQALERRRAMLPSVEGQR